MALLLSGNGSYGWRGVIAAVSMAPVSMVEQMHEGARQEKQVRECAHQMRAVLSPQEVQRDRQKAPKHPFTATCMGLLVIGMVRMVHLSLRIRECRASLLPIFERGAVLRPVRPANQQHNPDVFRWKFKEISIGDRVVDAHRLKALL
jgi:hypothetical protein